ncbi:hypothetical protein C8R43DRAFT_910726, partial [Mycena crocata]
MVQVFIRDVLCWQSEEPGLYGQTAAYYASVEQQGRLTLHLHSLIWIMNCPSPQEIRDRLVGGDSVFERKMVEYLDGCHQGEFTHGSMEDVKQYVRCDTKGSPEEVDAQTTETYVVPTHSMPSVPPPQCTSDHLPEEGSCARCIEYRNWWLKYEHDVDDIVLRTNVHTCCLSKTGVCKARFPRDIVKDTTVEADGHINLRHLEARLNKYSKVVTFFSRCNTDVTSLLSGTSVKAVISYVSDYVSKLGLKTYQAFASVFDVFKK